MQLGVPKHRASKNALAHQIAFARAWSDPKRLTGDLHIGVALTIEGKMDLLHRLVGGTRRGAGTFALPPLDRVGGRAGDFIDVPQSERGFALEVAALPGVLVA